MEETPVLPQPTPAYPIPSPTIPTIPTPSPKKPWLKILVITALLVGLGIAGAYAYLNYFQTKDIVTSETRTYTSDKHKFKFNFPSDWVISPVSIAADESIRVRASSQDPRNEFFVWVNALGSGYCEGPYKFIDSSISLKGGVIAERTDCIYEIPGESGGAFVVQYRLSNDGFFLGAHYSNPVTKNIVESILTSYTVVN